MSLNITDAIFRWCDRDPHAIAVIDAERTIDYRMLCGSVCRAAQRFQQAGWTAGDIVGISFRDSPVLHLVTSLALARMGITQVSFPASDPTPLSRLRIEQLGVCGLVIEDGLVAVATSVVTVTPATGWLAESMDSSSVNDIRAPGGDGIWIITESSGTTGQPKVIGISHALEEAHGQRQAAVYAHRPGERFLNLAGLRFLIGIKRAIRCLSDGGTLTLPPAACNSDQLLNWIELHNVTYISCVPFHLHQLLRDIRTDSPRLPSLRILRCSSAALPVATLNEVRRRISPNVYVGYGLSEISAIAAATPEMLAEHPDTVGRPLNGIELEIADDLDRPLPFGASGQVRVRGLGIQPTYLQADAQEVLRVFRNGWCYPGDIGLKSEAGLVFLKGRADDVMNFNGIMIGPGEIESVLRLHPAVAEAAAFALPSPEHQDIPVAAVVSSQALDLNELGQFCAERLGFRAPRMLFQIDEIPKNPMGKILRRRLTELAAQKLRAQSHAS